MHPFALMPSLTESRASRRRARRAAIAVVAGLLALPGTKAFGDQPHSHLAGGHAGVHYQPTATPAPENGGGGVDWEVAAIAAATVLTVGGLTLPQRRRPRTVT